MRFRNGVKKIIGRSAGWYYYYALSVGNCTILLIKKADELEFNFELDLWGLLRSAVSKMNKNSSTAVRND
jgi:hypothetical protein